MLTKQFNILFSFQNLQIFIVSIKKFADIIIINKFSYQTRPNILWSLIWIQIVCKNHWLSSKQFEIDLLRFEKAISMNRHSNKLIYEVWQLELIKACWINPFITFYFCSLHSNLERQLPVTQIEHFMYVTKQNNYQ